MTERASTAAWTDPWLPVALLGLLGAGLAFHVTSGPAPFDAGELAAASWSLGGSHPPGQPLHAIVARLFAFLPLGPLPARMALCSVACAVVVAALVMHATRTLLRVVGIDDARLVAAAALAAGLGTALAAPVLRQTLRVEVYTLALACVVYGVAALFAWLGGDGARALWRAALAGGLAASIHPPHGIALALVALVVLVAQPKARARRPGVLAVAVACGIAGLAVYAYLPLRAAAGAPMWGTPLELAGFWDYVSAKAYWQNNLANPNRSLPREVYEYGAHLVLATSIAPLIGAFSLPLRCPAAQARFAWCAVAAAGAALLAACLQPFEARNPDNVAWLGPAVALTVMTGASGFAAIAMGRPRWLGLLGLAVVGLAPATTAQLRAYLRTDVPALESLAGSLVDTPPPRALVVATSDFAASSWLAARSIDGARPDTAVFFPGLATSSWHWATLAEHPALDAHPRRGPGANPHEQYLNGLLDGAAPRMPIAAEHDLPGIGAARLAGPYVLFGTLAASGTTAFMAERIVAGIVPDPGTPPHGDADLGSAILRDYETTRARRLLAAGRTPEAFAALARAAWSLPAEDRASITALRGTVERPTPPLVRDPDAFLLSAEDVARVAAVHAWSLGATQTTQALLERQTARGDARALLQLAWLRLFEGNHAEARRALEAFATAAPDLAHEGLRLNDLVKRDE